MTAVELTLRDVHRDKDAVWSWLRAHDLDPLQTAPGVLIEDGTVTATVWLRNEKGERYVERDPYDGSLIGAAHKVVTIPLRQPLPEHLGTATA